MKNLTSKEKLFCAYYCVSRNEKEAAAKSGYKFPERSGMKLLEKKHIRQYIENTDKERNETRADISCGFYRLAFGCVSDAVKLMFLDEISADDIERFDLFNISEIKRKKGGDIEIKFFDRLKALQLLSEKTPDEESEKANGLYSAIAKSAAVLGQVQDECT